MRYPENNYCQWACPTEEEMDKELQLYLIEKYGLWELALKIFKAWIEQWKKDWYQDWYDEWYDKGYDEWYEEWYDDWAYEN